MEAMAVGSTDGDSTDDESSDSNDSNDSNDSESVRLSSAYGEPFYISMSNDSEDRDVKEDRVLRDKAHFYPISGCQEWFRTI